jgi:hypothetical protein
MVEAGFGKGRRVAKGRSSKAEVRHYHHDDIGDDALSFAKWYTRNKFQLMESFVGELDKNPMRRDPIYLRERFLDTLRHAKQVTNVRAVVTVLLALGAAATFVGTALDIFVAAPVIGTTAALTKSVFTQVAALASSLTLVLLVVRLALDRYLELVDVSAHYTAMQLASAR